jgi:3-hydroxyisobutyrate dehydrogenase-like beta-hydroxyacid dehydrogenase
LDSVASPKKIGLIGLGLMGRPMGMNLLKAGYSLTVWNRTASRADELVGAGAKLAKSPQEVAASADFLLSIVSDPPALEQVLWGPQGALPALPRGSTYVDSSTISPAPSVAYVFWTRPSPAATGAPKKANCFS